jgi:RluA family pseudouridine synthase
MDFLGWQIPILYSDEHLICVNKPAGLLSIPGGYNSNALDLHALLETEYGRLWTVHRLDKDTSGVILFARSVEAHKYLNDQFEKRLVKKTYHVLVDGQPPKDEFETNAPLFVDGNRRHMTVVNHQMGKPALTLFKVLARYQQYSLIQASPQTGYTHQIRAHLLFLGFPILADPLYKFPETKETLPTNSSPRPDLASIISRTALHALQIILTHPATHLELCLQAPYPVDFQKAVDHLSNH